MVAVRNGEAEGDHKRSGTVNYTLSKEAHSTEHRDREDRRYSSVVRRERSEVHELYRKFTLLLTQLLHASPIIYVFILYKRYYI